MSTKTTRALGGLDFYDCQGIKVEAEDYDGKTGIIHVSVTNYTWANGSSDTGWAQLDLRAPNFCPDCDTALLDVISLTNATGNVNVTKDYYFAVNGGTPGPAIFIQGDGSWDLLWLKLQLTEGHTVSGATATITYTVSFTDLTPSSQPAPNSTTAVSVTNEAPKDTKDLLLATSAFAAQNGYVWLFVTSVDVTVVDRPSRFQRATGYTADYPPLGYLPAPGRWQTDSAPLLMLSIVPNPTGFGRFVASGADGNPVGNTIYGGATSKTAGTRNPRLKSRCLFAINNGKIDGNALISGSNGVFGRMTFQKIPSWPCDDDVTATMHYLLAFTAL